MANFGISELLQNIEINFNRKNNIECLLNLINNKNGYTLKLVTGIFMNIDDILGEIGTDISKMKSIYDNNGNPRDVDKVSKIIIDDYLQKYHVHYQFINITGQIIDCHYMEPCIKLYKPSFNYLKIKINEDNYCIINPPRNYVSSYGYYPINMPFEHVSLKINLQLVNDFLYFTKISYSIEGNLNIIMCLAAQFAKDILNKKYFYLHVITHNARILGLSYEVVSYDKLFGEIYPSFGFKLGYEDDVRGFSVNTDKTEMYAEIKDIINNCKRLL